MDYQRTITEVLFVIAIVFTLFYFGEDMMSFVDRMSSGACNRPIEYSIGEVDSGFGVSSSYFLEAIKEAEAIWEDATGKDLFDGVQSGGMPINLIYDYRQDTTIKLDTLDTSVRVDNSTYLSLKAEYERNVATYNSKLSTFNSLEASYKQRSARYQVEVDNYNKGKGSKDKYDQLNAELNYLQKMSDQITVAENEINQLATTINQQAQQLNALAAKLNIKVERFNEINSGLEGEFEQGNYTIKGGQRSINIYQFQTRSKLVRVLAHEMGHALGLEHIDDPDDIMYSLNVGESDQITEADLSQLDDICSKKGWQVYFGVK